MKLIISPSFLFGSFLFQDRVPTNQKEKKSQITNKEKQKCQKKKKKKVQKWHINFDAYLSLITLVGDLVVATSGAEVKTFLVFLSTMLQRITSRCSFFYSFSVTTREDSRQDT